MSDLYYVQRKPSGFLGNSPIWWGKGGNGYTAYIQGAEQFTEEEAMSMIKKDSNKWAIYKVSEVNKRLHLVFDSQDIKRLGTDEGCGWPGGYANHDLGNVATPLTTE